MPKKVSPFIKYRRLDAYKNLQIIKDDTYHKLKNLYKDNVWDLKEKLEELNDFNKELNLNIDISWLNGIQYLDYVSFDKLKFNPVSLKTFKEGGYKNLMTQYGEDNSPTTEKRYAERIIFFTKNLPSFQIYEKQDDLRWVVINNRLLFYEILKYHNDKSNALLTTTKDIKSMMRVILLLLGDKNELRMKYPVLSTDLKELDRLAENENRVQSKSEINTFVPFENLLDLVDKLQADYDKEFYQLPMEVRLDGKKHPNTLFNKHQELLALALYTFDFPSRAEKT
jgi:hypothetical protein